jgi:glucan exporter ATP-binding protein
VSAEPHSTSLSTTASRALGLLLAERRQSAFIIIAGLALAAVPVIEQVLLARVVDALAAKAPAFSVIALWAAVGLVGIITSVTVAVLADRLAHRRRLAVLAAAYERALALSAGYHAERGSGSVVRAILVGTDALFWNGLSLLREQFVALAGLLVLIPTAFRMNPQMASVLIVLGATYALANIAIARRTQSGQAEVEHHHGTVYGRVGDVIGNVTVVQSYGRFAAEMQAMRAIMAELLAAQYPVLTWWGLLTVLTRTAATITVVVLYALGSIMVARDEISVGEVVAFVGFSGLLIGKLDSLSGFAVRIMQSLPPLRSLFELMDAKEAVAEAADAKPLQAVRGQIRFEQVSFRFPGSGLGVHNLNFEVPAGSTVALVGSTGAGKSTTLALLQRLRAPDSGRILIDDQDIARVTLASLRDHLAVVFQDSGLFNRPISENIAIGRPDASQQDIAQAALLAEAHDFIMSRPGGYDFVIGERGASLSGGERQRLAIARAILRNAPILLLDEATSALDVQTEARIKRALDTLRRGRTTLIIAHRLSTVADADQILVMDRGEIVESGSYGGLLAKRGRFAAMVEAGGFSEPEASSPKSDRQADS